MEQNHYDLIVVGAGPGGCAAAKTAAEKKLKVLMLERAEIRGSKNMSGSLFFKPISESIFPGISQQDFTTCHPMGGDIRIANCNNDGTYFGIAANLGKKIGDKMLLIFRNESDKWLAEQAVKAGATIRTAVVRDLIIENNVVKGVIVDNGERIEAPLTIAADGIHSTIARKSGLGRRYTNTCSKINLGIKYVFKLPPEVLYDRVGVDGTDSCDLGTVFNGMDPINWCGHIIPSPKRGIAVVTIYHHVADLAAHKINSHQRMKWFLDQPEPKRILKGAEFLYFNAHCLNWLEWEGYAKKAHMAGLMLVGAAAGLGNPFDGFGANVAMATGQMAGEVAVLAKAKKNYSEEMLEEYDTKWRSSFVGRDEEMSCDMSRFMCNSEFSKIWGALEGAAANVWDAKLENKPYPEIFSKELGPLLTIIPQLTRAFPLLGPVLQPYSTMAKSLMGGE